MSLIVKLREMKNDNVVRSYAMVSFTSSGN